MLDIVNHHVVARFFPFPYSYITKSTNKLKFLYRNARSLDSKFKAVLTSALIQCHFDYASAIWYSGLTQTFKTKLLIVQNKIIRFILDLPAWSHVGYVEFSKAKMFPVHKRVEQLKMNHIVDSLVLVSSFYGSISLIKVSLMFLSLTLDFIPQFCWISH